MIVFLPMSHPFPPSISFVKMLSSILINGFLKRERVRFSFQSLGGPDACLTVKLPFLPATRHATTAAILAGSRHATTRTHVFSNGTFGYFTRGTR